MSNRFISSQLLNALEDTWTAIKAEHPDLPRAVIIVASGMEGTKTPHWGHWAAGRWTVESGEAVGEVKIGGERLEGGAEAVLETLLHEAGHALAFARGRKDTSRQGRYHNKTYKALALEVGLTCKQMGSYGWTDTDLAEGTAERYADILQALNEAIKGSFRKRPYRRGGGEAGANTGGASGDDAEEGKKGTAGSRALYQCKCEKPRKMRMSESVAELGPIVCGVCGEVFEKVGE